jgi:hypothetical protein
LVSAAEAEAAGVRFVATGGGKVDSGCLAGSVVTEGGGNGVSWLSFFEQPAVTNRVTAAAAATADGMRFILSIAFLISSLGAYSQRGRSSSRC